jgi:hypothetical protein
VFCVSNTDYWECRDLPEDSALPLLDLSGILELRRYCISLLVTSQLRIAVKYIHHGIPAILSAIKLWVQSGIRSMSVEQKETILKTFNTFEARLRKVNIQI